MQREAARETQSFTMAFRRKGRQVLAALAFTVATAIPAYGQAFQVTNIVSDGSVAAPVMDANFINPWGMSTSANWWISTAGTGFNYVIPATTGAIAFKVIVPSGANPNANGPASGAVATSGATGMILPNGTIASFLFSTLDGTISGWNSKLGTANALSQIVVNNSASGAAYTGLALLNTSAGSYLLAPNFASGSMEVYDSSFKPAKLAGSFTDPNLPSGYVPFGVHILNNQVFVTYAQHTATAPYRELVSAGVGIVDVYDSTGVLTARAITGGSLNAPWGVAYAPANFGIYSNDLLVGNFGDGTINAFDPTTYSYVGKLMDSTGKPLVYAALWDLLTGGTKITNSTAVSGGSVNTVYFTAGLTDEKHGLLAGISNTIVAGSTPTFGFTSSTSAVAQSAGSTTTFGVSVAPVNGFTGNVALTCTGLPVGAVCTVTPAQVNVSANAVSLASVQIASRSSSAANGVPSFFGRHGKSLALACCMPLFSLALFRRQAKNALRLASMVAALLLMGGVVGCGDSLPTTPPGTSQVVVQAVGSNITQQAGISLTVQ